MKPQETLENKFTEKEVLQALENSFVIGVKNDKRVIKLTEQDKQEFYSFSVEVARRKAARKE